MAARKRPSTRREINADIIYLMERGIRCERLSDYHFRVTRFFDYWPTTGKWKALYGSQTGRGRASLEKAVRAAFGKSAPRLEDAP